MYCTAKRIRWNRVPHNSFVLIANYSKSIANSLQFSFLLLSIWSNFPNFFKNLIKFTFMFDWIYRQFDAIIYIAFDQIDHIFDQMEFLHVPQIDRVINPMSRIDFKTIRNRNTISKFLQTKDCEFFLSKWNRRSYYKLPFVHNKQISSKIGMLEINQHLIHTINLLIPKYFS